MANGLAACFQIPEAFSSSSRCCAKRESAIFWRLDHWEMAAVFDDFAQLHMQTFNCVGCINHFSNVSRIGKERNHLFPLSSPHLANDRECASLTALLKIFQSLLRSFQLAKASELRIKWTAGLTGSADRRLGSVRKAMQPI